MLENLGELVDVLEDDTSDHVCLITWERFCACRFIECCLANGKCLPCCLAETILLIFELTLDINNDRVVSLLVATTH